MEEQKKCSLEEHKEIMAMFYCPECQVYMCNNCQNCHPLFLKHHHIYKIESTESELFTGYCKEKGHPNQLKYFCKSHNQLCCANCIAKISEMGDGQHKDCEICTVEKIKEAKKNKLLENIKCLEDLENKFTEIFEEIKNKFNRIEKDKEELKSKIQKIFTRIRNTLNDREDELLLKVDNLFNVKYFNEDIIKKGEKLPRKIKESLKKGKLINNEWNAHNLIANINDCINIEKNINDINIIKEGINKCKIYHKKEMKFIPKEDSLNEFLNTIKSFGKITNNNQYEIKECPININKSRKYIGRKK